MPLNIRPALQLSCEKDVGMGLCMLCLYAITYTFFFGTSIPTSLKEGLEFLKLPCSVVFWLSKYNYLDQGFGQRFNFFVCVWKGGFF